MSNSGSDVFYVDPSSITRFDRSESELEVFWLFCLVVAGKTAHVQARKLDSFLSLLKERYAGVGTPFEMIAVASAEGHLNTFIQQVKLGQYHRLVAAFIQSVSRFQGRMSTVSLHDLESIYGVGPKTSRLYLMHSRPDQKLASLDTHVLAYLRDMGIDAPMTTPSSKVTYLRLEEEFLRLAEENGYSPADFDLAIWNARSRKEKIPA